MDCEIANDLTIITGRVDKRANELKWYLGSARRPIGN
jgi:hypothetical protein